MSVAAGSTAARAQRGFTLIEVLVALLVFVTGIAGLLALMTTALAMHRDGLTLARATRDLEGVKAQVQREVAAGQHYDGQHDAFVDVAGATLPDGTAWALHFLPARGAQPLLAEIRVAGNVKELARARPVPVVLSTGPSLDAAIESYRRRDRTPSLPGPPDH